MNSIAFFYPSHLYGGAELLLSRVAIILSKKGYNITLIDVDNGTISKIVEHENIKIIKSEKYSPQEVEFDILITTANKYSDIFNWISPMKNSRVIFWSVHVYNMYIFSERFAKTPILSKVYNGFLRKTLLLDWKLMKERIELFNRKKGLYCMDSASRKSIEKEYKLKINENYIPVFTDVQKLEYRTSNNSSDKIEVFFLSRLSDCKVPPIIYICKELSKLKQNIKVNIIGDGVLFDDLKKHISSLDLDMEFYGVMPSHEAKELLVRKADILFANGTSALDGASLAIPTVNIDGCLSDYPENYRFIWIFQREGYSLGDIIDKDSSLHSLGHTMPSLLSQLEKNSAEIGGKCKKYHDENHSLETVINKVEKAILDCELYLKDVKKIDEKISMLKLWDLFKKYKDKMNKINR